MGGGELWRSQTLPLNLKWFNTTPDLERIFLIVYIGPFLIAYSVEILKSRLFNSVDILKNAPFLIALRRNGN